MPNGYRRASLLLLLLASLFSTVARAQVTAPVTALDRQLSRIDLGVSGMGEFTTNAAGKNYLNDAVTQQPSNTVGALVNIRYIKSPLVGLEFNYSYARYTQNFTFTDPSGNVLPILVGGAQTNANEYTVGYIVHTPKLLGISTFVSAGAGSTEFKGTPGGGQGLPTQARMTYYYTAGVEQSVLSPHFGVRAEFRQAFFLAPDFGQNYLTIKQRQISTEPAIGFYLHF